MSSILMIVAVHVVYFQFFLFLTLIVNDYCDKKLETPSADLLMAF